MRERLALITCIGDPRLCVESDILVLTHMGVEPVIWVEGLNINSVSAVKVSFIGDAGVLERALKSLGRSIPLVIGPGVDTGYIGSLGYKPTISVGFSEKELILEYQGVKRRIVVEGCDPAIQANIYSTLAAGYMALGFEPPDAIERISGDIDVIREYDGCRSRILAPGFIKSARYETLINVKSALDLIVNRGKILIDKGLVPEVGINIAMSLPPPLARHPGDVAAIPGRIVRVGEELRPVTPYPEYGASRHLARAILAYMRFNPRIRAVVNALYRPEAVNAAASLGMAVSFYDRREEPPHVKAREGATIPWGIETALKRAGSARVDVIYHNGDWGKEPMMNVFGETAVEAVEKLISIAENIGPTRV